MTAAQTAGERDAAPGVAISQLPDGTGLRLDGEADLATRAALHAAIVALDAEVVHLYLGGLRFVCTGCLDEIMTLTEPPRRLVLHDPPAVMLRMINLLWPGQDLEVDAP